MTTTIDKSMPTCIERYFSLQKDHVTAYGPKTITLFQVGAFFEVYGYNATDTALAEFSRICDLRIAAKSNRTFMSGFKEYQLDRYLAKLIDHGITVPVYVQVSEGENLTRNLSCVYSPSTFTNINDTPKTSNNLMCIAINVNEKRNTMQQAMVCLDMLTSQSTYWELERDYYHRPTTYDQLENNVVNYAPTEVIIFGNVDTKMIEQVVQYIGCYPKTLHIRSSLPPDSNYYQSIDLFHKYSYQNHVIEQTHGGDHYIFDSFYSYPLALTAYCMVLDFVKSRNPLLLKTLVCPSIESSHEYVYIANNAMTQLNIVDKRNKTCVLNLLNKCITNMGKKLFAKTLTTPIHNTEKLSSIFHETESLSSNHELLELWRTELPNIKSLESLAYRKAVNMFRPVDVATMHGSILATLKVLTQNYNYIGLGVENIDSIITSLKRVVQSIEASFDLDECCKYNSIRESIDLSLKSIIKKHASKSVSACYTNSYRDTRIFETLVAFLNNAIRSVEKKKTDTQYVRVHESEKQPAVLLTTQRRGSILMDALGNVSSQKSQSSWDSFYKFESDEDRIHVTSLVKDLKLIRQTTTASNVVVTSEKILELTNRIRISISHLYDCVKSYFAECISSIVDSSIYMNAIDISLKAVAEIDLMQCRVKIAKKYNLTRPTLLNNGKSCVTMTGVRHLLVEQSQLNDLYVTNDVQLDETTTGILLYGTNSVGKTCLIKAMGIAIVMAQSGFFVPCKTMSICPYRELFARIETHDDISKGLSTFTAEMSELRTILRYSTPHSLVLGDELCSGTENQSAISIFACGVRTFADAGTTFVFATHFHELGRLPQIKSLSNVKMFHMRVIYDFSTGEMVFDRKIYEGSGTANYGLEVCKGLNLPTKFIDYAYDIREDVRKLYKNAPSTVAKSKASRYNKKKIVEVCESCKINLATETHHVHEQNTANANGYIETDRHSFHKDSYANLKALCADCHKKLHHSDG